VAKSSIQVGIRKWCGKEFDEDSDVDMGVAKELLIH